MESMLRFDGSLSVETTTDRYQLDFDGQRASFNVPMLTSFWRARRMFPSRSMRRDFFRQVDRWASYSGIECAIYWRGLFLFSLGACPRRRWLKNFLLFF